MDRIKSHLNYQCFAINSSLIEESIQYQHHHTKNSKNHFDHSLQKLKMQIKQMIKRARMEGRNSQCIPQLLLAAASSPTFASMEFFHLKP